jgi:hypothetical protein
VSTARRSKILRVEGAGKMAAIAEKRVEAIMAGLDNQSITLPRPTGCLATTIRRRPRPG